MARNLAAAVLLAFALQACRANMKQAGKNSEAGWEDCARVPGIPCATRKVGDKKAAKVFAAFREVGVEAEKGSDSEQFSVLLASCVKTTADYECAFKYHQPDKDGELTPQISIFDGDGQNNGKAKALYIALVKAGVKEDCNTGTCVVAVTSAGCRKISADGSTDCYLAKGTAVEVAW